MRVAFITTTYPLTRRDPHGHFIARIAEEIAARGVSVTVHSPHVDIARDGEMRNGVAIERFRYAPDAWERVALSPGILSNVRRDPRALLALPGFLLSARVAARRAARHADILHVHWAQTAFISNAGALDVPMVLTIHGSDLELGRVRGFRRSVTGPVAQADAVVAVSRNLATQLEPFMPAGKTPYVIGGGVEAALLDLAQPVRADTGGPVRLLLVGRLMKGKGVYDLCEALTRIREGFHLTVVGVGPAREAMQARFDAAGIPDAIEFAGSVEHGHVIEMMRDADLVVMPSHSEGCGIVPIEAAAVGTAIVVTRTGAMPDVAACPESVVEPGDVDGLERALRIMLSDAALREECAVRAREQFDRDFTWEHIADRYVELYENTLAARGGAR